MLDKNIFNELEDNIDDIMESIMKGQSDTPPSRQRNTNRKERIVSSDPARKEIRTQQHSQGLHRRSPIRSTAFKEREQIAPQRILSKQAPKNQGIERRGVPVTIPAKSKGVLDQPLHKATSLENTPGKIKKTGLKKSALIITVALFLILLPTISFILLKEPIMALLKPKSPFSTELAEQMKVPLYYPTKLPGSYKMEINSITQPEDNILLYAITDDNNNKINISIQKQTDSVNLEGVYSNLSNLEELQTKYGSIKIGDTTEGMSIANVFIGQSWLIVTSKSGTVSSDNLVQIVNSLEF